MQETYSSGAPGQKWNGLIRELKSEGFLKKLRNAMVAALDFKRTFYTTKLANLNERIVMDQVELLQTWCEFSMRKAWLYYVDQSGTLKEINTEQKDSDIVSAKKGQPSPEISEYLVSMGFKDKSEPPQFLPPSTQESLERMKKVLSYLQSKNQCDTFTQHWTKTPGDNKDSRMRMLASNRDALEAIANANQNFFQALKESQRIGSILDTIKSMQPADPRSADRMLSKRLKLLTKALSDFDERMFGDTRGGIKDQVAAIVRGFVASPTLYRSSHLSISLTGPPGTGKTTIAGYVGKILAALGILVKADTISQQTRATMVGQYIGETADKVNNILRSNIEGIIFIDEAYSLAQASGGEAGGQQYDPYGVEAINEIVGFLDKYKGQICIITAGYKEEMQKYFFDVNTGMARRFRWFWPLPPFAPSELFCIMALQLSFLDMVVRNRVRDTLDIMVSAEGQTLINSLLHDCLQIGCGPREPPFDFEKWQTIYNRHLEELRETQGEQEARKLMMAKDELLAKEYYITSGKERKWAPFREYFQNEGGDTENLAAQLAATYYQLGGRQLDLQSTLEVVWNYIEQRDGNVLIQRGKAYKAPAQFKESIFYENPTAIINGETIRISFEKESVKQAPEPLMALTKGKEEGGQESSQPQPQMTDLSQESTQFQEIFLTTVLPEKCVFPSDK